MAHPQTPPTFNPVITGSDEYSVELNDANITAKAWKSSRYDGSKTETAVLNQYSEGDISVGKTTAVQKYSRNIYLGNGVIGMDENGGEDTTLLNYPNFSYITTLKYITVNEDNTISTDIVESKPNDFNSRRGFYRSFYEDFSEKSSCKIIINDVSIKTNLKDSYEVYFNGGQLQKLFLFKSPTDFFATRYNPLLITQSTSFPSSQSFFPGDLGGDIFQEFELFNLPVATQFFKDNSGNRPSILTTDYFNFISRSFAFKDSSEYIGDKRFFISFCESGSESEPKPIYTITTGSVPDDTPGLSINSNNLSEISTGEIINFVGSGPGNTSISHLHISERFQFNQQYYLMNTSSTVENGGNADDPVSLSGVPRPFIGNSGPYIITKTEDATPSLLVKLDKNTHLPDGIGRNGFVIIPDNLHPHVKKNLTHFLAKAGVSLDLDTIPALDTTFERLS